MATLYLKTAGGNWTDAGAWSTVNAGGVDNSGPPTSSDDCIAEALSGQVTISGTSVGKSFSATGGTGDYTGTFTHNAFTLTFSGSVTFSAGMTYTALATSTIALSSTGTFTTAGKLLPNVNITNNTTTMGDNWNFLDAKNISITMSAASWNLNGKTVAGFSKTSRVLVRSNSLGVSRTITINGGAFNGCDLRDLAANVATDISAASDYTGDCGGTSNFTFTPAATQTYTGGTDNWSTIARWTSRVPLPQDDVSMSGVTGGTITIDMPRLGRNIDWTGASGSPTVAHSLACTIYGGITFITAMTVTQTTNITFEGRSSFMFTRAGRTLANSINQSMIGGTMTLLDTMALAGTWNLTNGTFDDGGFASSFGVFQSTNSNTRAITKSGVMTLTSTTTPWILTTSTGCTLTDTGTILLSDTSGTTKTFAGGGLTTYNDIKIAALSTVNDRVTFTGANTFNRIYTDGGGTKLITLPGSTTTTLLSGAGLGNGTNIITFTASAGSATVSKAGGVVAWSSVSLTNIIASATGATYYAGVAPPSVDGGGNTNWLFQEAPVISITAGSIKQNLLLLVG